MQHKGTVKLETERLILRKHVLNDAPAMYKNWASEKEVTEFLSWEPYHSIEDVQKILSEWISQYANNDFYFWTNAGELLSPFDIVQVEHLNHSITYGRIDSISHVTDSASHLSSFISSDFGFLHRRSFGR